MKYMAMGLGHVDSYLQPPSSTFPTLSLPLCSSHTWDMQLSNT